MADYPNEINEPIAALAERLQAAGYDQSSPIVASDAVLGGMLRAQFPRASVTVCPPEPQGKVSRCMLNVPRRTGAAAEEVDRWLLVARAIDPPPGWWQSAGPLPDMAVVQSVELPYLRFPASAPRMRYQFLWHPLSLQP